MKKTLFVILMLSSIITNAQSKGIQASANQGVYVDAIAGSFRHWIGNNDSVNVNYSLSPAYPGDKAKLFLHTPDPMPFQANITDKAGHIVYTWKPKEKVYMYNVDLDLKKLKSGDYFLNIFLDTEQKSIYTINFSKK